MLRALPLLLLAGCAASRPFTELPADADVRWFTAGPGGGAFAERQGRVSYLHFGGRRYGPYP